MEPEYDYEYDVKGKAELIKQFWREMWKSLAEEGEVDYYKPFDYEYISKVINIRDTIDDMVYQNFGVLAHSPIEFSDDLELYGICIEINPPDYKVLLENKGRSNGIQ